MKSVKLCAVEDKNFKYAASSWIINHWPDKSVSRAFDLGPDFDPERSGMCKACHLMLVVAKANGIAWEDRALREKVLKILAANPPGVAK